MNTAVCLFVARSPIFDAASVTAPAKTPPPGKGRDPDKGVELYRRSLEPCGRATAQILRRARSVSRYRASRFPSLSRDQNVRSRPGVNRCELGEGPKIAGLAPRAPLHDRKVAKMASDTAARTGQTDETSRLISSVCP